MLQARAGGTATRCSVANGTCGMSMSAVGAAFPAAKLAGGASDVTADAPSHRRRLVNGVPAPCGSCICAGAPRFRVAATGAATRAATGAATDAATGAATGAVTHDISTSSSSGAVATAAPIAVFCSCSCGVVPTCMLKCRRADVAARYAALHVTHSKPELILELQRL